MSKRYGRNQRRAHREALRVAEVRLLNTQNALEEERKAKRALAERIMRWARNIVTVLGPDHPLNEEIAVKVIGSLYGDTFRAHRRRPLSLEEVMPVHTIADLRVAQGILDLVVHRVRAKREPHGIPRVVLQLQVKDGPLAYAIDEQYLQEGRRDPRFYEWLTEQIARELQAVLAEAA